MSVTLAPSANTANAPLNAKTAALAASLTVKTSLGVLYGVAGYSTTAQFLQVHDLAGAPPGGAAPAFSIPIVANAPFSVDFGVYGMVCTNGIRIVNSTTGPTYTAGAADTFISARYA